MSPVDSNKVVLIVDPFSSGALYAPAFSALGYRCVAVRSSTSTSARFTRGFIAGDFSNQALLDINNAISQFDTREVAAVVAGCETGVEAADMLAAQLKARCNSPATSSSRRDKFAMQEALRSAGLPHIDTQLVKTKDAIAETLLLLGDTSAVYVVKPLNSASTDGVMFAAGREGVRAALDMSAWNAVNDLGEVNKGFVVQRFIEGPEYVVDMVAHAGGITVASLCRYDKIKRNGSQFVYAGLDILDPADPAYRPLIDYACKSAVALDLAVGPLHMELIWSATGPVMIEAGARMHGGIAPALFKDCYAPNLLDLSVDAYVGKKIDTRYAEQTCHGRIVFLYNDTERPYTENSSGFGDALHTLESYRGHKIFVAPGDLIPKTIDLATCPGIVWFASDSTATLRADEALCRQFAY